MAAVGQIRLAVLTPRELRHTFVSVISESGVAVEDRPAGRALQLEDDRGHLPLHELRPVITTGADVMDQIFV